MIRRKLVIISDHWYSSRCSSKEAWLACSLHGERKGAGNTQREGERGRRKEGRDLESVPRSRKGKEGRKGERWELDPGAKKKEKQSVAHGGKRRGREVIKWKGRKGKGRRLD